MREQTMTTLTDSKMISASELSRLVNRPTQRVLKAIHAGVINPDATVLDGRLHLFRESRLDEIKGKLAAA